LPDDAALPPLFGVPVAAMDGGVTGGEGGSGFDAASGAVPASGAVGRNAAVARKIAVAANPALSVRPAELGDTSLPRRPCVKYLKSPPVVSVAVLDRTIERFDLRSIGFHALSPRSQGSKH
jgi:hypothetical protein